MTDTASGAGTDDAAYVDPNSSYFPPDALPSPQPVPGYADEYGGLSPENYEKALEFFNELKDAASRVMTKNAQALVDYMNSQDVTNVVVFIFNYYLMDEETRGSSNGGRRSPSTT